MPPLCGSASPPRFYGNRWDHPHGLLCDNDGYQLSHSRVVRGLKGGQDLLDDDLLHCEDSRIGAEGSAQIFCFLPCLVFVVGLDQ